MACQDLSTLCTGPSPASSSWSAQLLQPNFEGQCVYYNIWSDTYLRAHKMMNKLIHCSIFLYKTDNFLREKHFHSFVQQRWHFSCFTSQMFKPYKEDWKLQQEDRNISPSHNCTYHYIINVNFSLITMNAIFIMTFLYKFFTSNFKQMWEINISLLSFLKKILTEIVLYFSNL